MGVRSRLSAVWGAMTGRGVPPGGGASVGIGGGPYALDAFGVRPAPSPWRLVESYKSLIYTCANLNANGLVRVPLRLYATTSRARGERLPRCLHRSVDRRQARHLAARVPHAARAMAGSDRVDEVVEGPWLDLVDRPCEGWDRTALLHYFVLSMDVAGDAYGRIVAPPGFAPSELWPLQPQSVFPVVQADEARPSAYRYFRETYPAGEVLEVKHVSLRNPYGRGMGPTEAALQYAGLEDKFVSVQDQVLSSPRPGMMFSPETERAPLGEPERMKLEADLNRKYSGPGASRSIVASTPLRGQPITHPPTDLGGLQLSRYDLERTANCFGVPISLLTSETNLANVQASHRQHAELAIEPRCLRLAAALTMLAQRYERRLFWAFDSAVAEDRMAETKIYDMKVKNGTATINEARAADGCAPVPWGDEPPAAIAAGIAPAEAPAKGQAPDDPPGVDASGDAPAEAPAKGVAPVEDVQAAVLNGAQISSLLEIVQAVATGQIPPDAAKALIAASFPSLQPADVDAIVDPIIGFEPREPGPADGATGNPTPTPTPTGGGPTPKADAERALIDRLSRYLDRLDAPDHPGRRDAAGDLGGPQGGSGCGDADADGVEEHLWAADGQADREETEGVPAAAAQDGAGIAADDRDPAA